MTSCWREQLSSVQKPYQYVGREENTYNKDFAAAAVRICLAFPDAYEIGTANLGMQIIYHTINEQPDFMADRTFAPLEDMGALLKTNGEQLTARESGRPLGDFDCIGFSLQYELCYTNVLYMLDLAQIPLRSKDRRESDPLICAGGPCVFNVEPIADFLDFAVLGEGEEVILEVADCIAAGHAAGKKRAQILFDLSRIKGIYVPGYFVPLYDDQKRFVELKRGPLAPRLVERRIVADLNSVAYPTAPVTPAIKPVHERVSVEIQRGCTRSCRFCQAGYVYRPRRERNPQRVVQLIEESIKNTGIYEVGLLSLSSADYSHLHPVMKALMDRYRKEHLSISLPSTRLEALQVEYLDVLKEERRSGFTIAPEAGSQRMREVINKNFTEQEIIDTVKMLYSNGWQHVKMYFMIGLPTETDEDVIAIANVGNAVYRATSHLPGKKQITISVSNFVPKPHTPFQWHEQISHEEIIRKQRLVRDNIRFPKNISLRTHNSNNSWVEGIVARGSRMTGNLIERAYMLGARFDCWQEKLNLGVWRQAVAELEQETGINLANEGMRGKAFDERLPWHRLYSGIHPKFFKNEFTKATVGMATEDCSFESCHECGLCNDHTGVAPVVNKQPVPVAFTKAHDDETKPIYFGPARHRRFRFQYQKSGSGVYISTLDLQAQIIRAFMKAEIGVMFDNAIRSRPKLSMGPALPVGVSSNCEIFEIWLATDLDAPQIVAAANGYLPEEIKILTGQVLEKDDPSISDVIKSQTFRAFLKPMMAEYADLEAKIAEIARSDSYVVQRSRTDKRGTERSSSIDLRNHIVAMRVQPTHDGPQIDYTIAAQNGQTLTPYLLLESLVKAEVDPRTIPVQKLGFATH